MISESAAVSLLLALLFVCCAWMYPRLNGWVYRRRVARDATAARDAAGESGTTERR
jgi:hypothetical protein